MNGLFPLTLGTFPPPDEGYQIIRNIPYSVCIIDADLLSHDGETSQFSSDRAGLVNDASWNDSRPLPFPPNANGTVSGVRRKRSTLFYFTASQARQSTTHSIFTQ